MHWKSLRRQIRVRGDVTREEGPQADAYFASRSLQSRVGAWASAQSRPLDSRASLMAEAARQGLRHGLNPPRPPHWGGFRIRPVSFEFWADGAFRLHDRFRWQRATSDVASETSFLDETKDNLGQNGSSSAFILEARRSVQLGSCLWSEAARFLRFSASLDVKGRVSVKLDCCES